MGLPEVGKFISTEGGRFEGGWKTYKVNILFIYQNPLTSESWVWMIFMGCKKNVIFPR